MLQLKFTDEALMTILGVPRVFLSVVLKGCVDWAKENNVELIFYRAPYISTENELRKKNYLEQYFEERNNAINNKKQRIILHLNFHNSFAPFIRKKINNKK